jgi:REP element-mobilizing transposase RayT
MKANVKTSIKEQNCRKTQRLEGFDYGTDGAYFVTICSDRKRMIFSEIVNGEIHLSSVGRIIDEELEKTKTLRGNTTITEWIIMPNHIHCIIFIHKDSDEPEHLSPKGTYLFFPEGYKNKFGPQSENLASIIRGIKSAVTTRAKKSGIAQMVWQPRYYEHIIRNEVELDKIVLYIKENPFKWEEDENFPENM